MKSEPSPPFDPLPPVVRSTSGDSWIRSHRASRAPVEDGPLLAHQWAEEPERGGLPEYWRIFSSHKLALIVPTLIGGLAGVLISLSQTPVYQAHASLEIEEPKPDPSDIKQAAPISEPNAPTALTDIPTQIKILQSETLIRRAMAKLGMENNRENRQLYERSHPLLPLPFRYARKAETEDEILASARNNLSVRADGQTRIVDIGYDSTNAKHAADFANALASEFIEQNIEARWNLSQRTGEWLNRQLEDIRVKLERSENTLQQYAIRSDLMFTSERNNVSDEKLRQLQTALAGAQMDRIAKQSRFEMFQTSSPEALTNMLNDPALREYESKLADLERRRAEMATMFTSEYAKMKQIDAQIASLQSSLQSQRAAIVQRIRNEYEETTRREKLLSDNYISQAHLINREAEKSIQYNILKREVDSNRQLYDAILQRMKTVNVAAALRASNVRVLDIAREPRYPYKPKIVVNAGLGSFTALLIAMILVIVCDRPSRTLEDRGEIQSHLRLPELGVIPLANRGWKRGGSRQNWMHARKEKGEVIVWPPGPSPFAEGFRAALTSILFSGRNGTRPQILVLTSWSPGEGKTTAVSNLGIALAEIGRRVLLVDGDMRKPCLHHAFDVENHKGLSDLLLSAEPLNPMMLQELMCSTSVRGLSILGSGPLPISPTNLFYSPRTKELFDLFRDKFDAVLIDTPPMQHISDARLLGAMADAVVLVCRASYTSLTAGRAATLRFAEDGTRVLGAILNCWCPRSGIVRYERQYLTK
jgi:succinoglycan biosynthesis transport protein ExoP